MCRAVALMRTAIHSTPNVFGMILWMPRGRVDRSETTRAVSLRTIQQSPGMRARPGLPPCPAVAHRVGNRFTDISVRVLVHSLHFILKCLQIAPIIASLSRGGTRGTLARPNIAVEPQESKKGGRSNRAREVRDGKRGTSSH